MHVHHFRLEDMDRFVIIETQTRYNRKTHDCPRAQVVTNVVIHDSMYMILTNSIHFFETILQIYQTFDVL
jgi:hypothetical protein